MDTISREISSLTPDQRALLELRLKRRRVSTRPAADGIARQDRRTAAFPLSFSQQRLWFMSQLDPQSPIYNIGQAVRLAGALNVDALRRTLTDVVARHEVLRTTFPMQDQQPVQVIMPPGPFELPLVDLRDQPPEAREDACRALARAHLDRPFDLARDLPMRGLLVRIDEETHVLVLALHHIAFDGWSMGVLIRELRVLYEAFCGGLASPLGEPPIQYADYAVWQREWLQGDVLARQLAYWEAHLKGAPMLCALPTDHPRGAVATVEGGKHTFRLSPALSRAVKTLGEREGTTLFMTLLAAFSALIARYTGEPDVVVGTSIANRSRPETQSLVGPCLNMLPLRTLVSGDLTVSGLLSRVRETALGAYTHQDLPFEKLVEHLHPERRLTQNPIIQVAFALLTTSERSDATLAGLTLTPVDLQNHTSKYDLSLLVNDEPDGIVATLEYRRELFEPATVGRLAGHFRTLLEDLVARPGARVSTLKMVTDDELAQLVHAWNQTDAAIPAGTYVHRLIEAQAARTPDAAAVRFGDLALRYEDLDRRANQLAHRLIGLGIGPERVVAIKMARGPELVVAILAAMKTGGAYLPLDPLWPGERTRFMIADAGAAVLLTERDLLDEAVPPGCRPLCAEDWAPSLEAEPATAPLVTLHADNAVYVIYTSGSSGRPKGVVITHGGLLNYLTWALTQYGTDRGTGSIVQSSIGFDLTVTSLFTPLLAGTTVTLVPEDDPIEPFCEAFARGGGFSFLKVTPGHLQALTERVGSRGASGRTGAFVIGGEALNADDLTFWRTHAPATRLINEYGPTETVVGSTVYEVGAGDPRAGSVSIGRPIANTRVYIVDALLQPVPVGVPGELCIGGAGVARGYAKRPDLSAEKFVPNPFSGRGDRLYRTGDLARYREDGNIEFLGRRDHQIKVRGYRIEIGEIEAALAEHPAVRQAVVVLHPDAGGPRLVAYIAPHPGEQTPAGEIRRFLKARLPDYMMPSAYVMAEALPLTPNGKVDRAALPSPAGDAAVVADADDTGDPIEQQLLQIWEDLLNVRPVRPTDSFFELGGHSLLGVRLMAVIHKRFEQHLPLAELFRGRTVRHLARLLRERRAAEPRSPLVELQPDGRRPPIFLVHPGDGSVACYEQLADRLRPDQPVYAFEAPHPVEGHDQEPSMRDRARAYVAAMREIRPQGPYFIGGYSFGSVVAFEMAQQLVEAGETVGLLALLDGGAPSIAERARERSDVIILASLARDLAREAGVSLAMAHEDLATLSRDEGCDHILETLKRANLLPPEVGPSWIRRFVRGVRSRIATVEQYRPAPYAGQITLFRSSESEPENTKAWLEIGIDPRLPTRGWEAFSDRAIEIHYVPGFHATMLKDRNVDVLAQQLKTCIDRALGCSPALASR